MRERLATASSVSSKLYKESLSKFGCQIGWAFGRHRPFPFFHWFIAGFPYAPFSRPIIDLYASLSQIIKDYVGGLEILYKESK